MQDPTAFMALEAAQNAEAAAREARAIATVRGYCHDRATERERQEYAAAVQLLYPKTPTPTPIRQEQMLLGGFILVTFTFGAIGLFHALLNGEDVFFGAMSFAFGAAATMIAGAILVLGVRFVFF